MRRELFVLVWMPPEFLFSSLSTIRFCETFALSFFCYHDLLKTNFKEKVIICEKLQDASACGKNWLKLPSFKGKRGKRGNDVHCNECRDIKFESILIELSFSALIWRKIIFMENKNSAAGLLTGFYSQSKRCINIWWDWWEFAFSLSPKTLKFGVH